MPFPMSISGSISFESLPVVRDRRDFVAKVITLLLKEVHVASVFVDRNVVRVEANLLTRQGLPKWFPRVVWSAKFTVEEKANASIVIEYHFRTLGLLLAAAVMSALLSTVFLVFFGQSVSAVAMVFALGWLWLFGANYLAGAFLFPRWLQRGLHRKILANSDAVAVIPRTGNV